MGGRSRPPGGRCRAGDRPPCARRGERWGRGGRLFCTPVLTWLSPPPTGQAPMQRRRRRPARGRPGPAPVPAGRGRAGASVSPRRAAGPGGPAALTAGRGGPTLCLGGWRGGGGSGGTRRGACPPALPAGYGHVSLHGCGGEHGSCWERVPGRLPRRRAPAPRPAPRGRRGAQRGGVFETVGDAVYTPRSRGRRTRSGAALPGAIGATGGGHGVRWGSSRCALACTPERWRCRATTTQHPLPLRPTDEHRPWRAGGALGERGGGAGAGRAARGRGHAGSGGAPAEGPGRPERVFQLLHPALRRVPAPAQPGRPAPQPAPPGRRPSSVGRGRWRRWSRASAQPACPC